MQKKWLLLCIFTISIDAQEIEDSFSNTIPHWSSWSDTDTQICPGAIDKRWYVRDRKPPLNIKNIFRTVWDEVIGIHRCLFDWDTLKIFALAFPACIGARMIDQDLQSCFYDWHHHKNKHTPPDWCHTVAEWAVAVPITFFGLQVFLGKDNEFRETNLTFLIGMPFVISGKDIIKNIRFDACLRPWNEKFGCEKRSSGGFPSGHAAEGAYMAVLYGLQYGPKFAIPLTLLTVGVSAIFLTCNRHYLSQLVAGVALGAMYGVAAHKFVQTKKIKRNIHFNMSVNENGGPAFSLAYTF